MVKIFKRKKLFDEDADWVPQKGRAFKMKTKMQKEEAPIEEPQKEEPQKEDPFRMTAEPPDIKYNFPQKERRREPEEKPAEPPPASTPQKAQKLYTDSEGLDMAYAYASNMFLDSQGTLFVSGTKGGLLDQEWIENYKTMGVPLIKKMMGMPSDYSIEENERYEQLDDFVKANPGKVKNMVAHSKGSAVVDKWMKNHPEFGGKSRLYATPYEDVLGKEKWKDRLNTFDAVRNAQYEGEDWKNPAEKWLEDKVVEKLTGLFGLDGVEGMKQRNELRLTTPTDPATLLDSSAEVENDPNWWKNAAKGFGHDYHTIASRRQGFDGDGSGLNHGVLAKGTDRNYGVLNGATPVPDTVPKMNTVSMIDSTVKTTWDTQPFNPFNVNPSYLTYDKTEGTKMTE